MSIQLQRLSSTLQRLPLSRKIVAISALSSLATLVALSSISFLMDWQNFRERKVNSLRTMGEIVSESSLAALIFNDPRTATNYIDSLEKEADVERAVIFDANRERFATFARSPGAADLAYPEYEGMQWSEGRLRYAQDILHHGETLGKILIEVNTDSFHASVRKSLLVSIFFLLGGLAITVFLASRLQRIVTRPVNELVALTRRIARDEDFSARAVRLYHDEVGSLVDSFNAMLDRISQRDASLREMNSRLERIVEERTEDLRKRNIALEEARDAANAASVAKSEFLATTSHELRTPLNPIIGYVEKMQREAPDGPYSRELALIRQSADQLLKLIDDILDFSRIERGTLRLGEDRVDIPELCDNVATLFEPQISDRPVELSHEHRDLLPSGDDRPLALIDEGRLRQVLLNLVSNAIKFTKAGSIVLRSTLAPKAKGHATLRIEVTDTGIGIAPEDQKKLFKPFSQLDGSWTREYGGMGLGLAISQRIVNAMGGRIRCESAPGAGSVFHFEITLKLVAREETDAPDDDPSLFHAPAETHVLLVEDEAVNRELMASLLASLGHRVTTARNGLEALRAAQQEPFDFVLLDISMPKLDGFATAKRLRQLSDEYHDVPIVAMTAHVTPEDKDRCFQAGMNDYLSKPVSFTKLRATLARWLEGKVA